MIIKLIDISSVKILLISICPTTFEKLKMLKIKNQGKN